jgi:thiosulfate/3-mercaptopyruvate sulfurtransferase
MTIQVNITQHARYLSALISVFALATACSKSNTHSNTVHEAKPPMEALVSTQWLSEHLEDPDLVVLDSTVLIDIGEDGGFNILSGRANYESGHIPSAGFADLMGNLSDPERPAQFIMPTAEQFAAAMGALGVGDDSRVVLYTANNPDWAARVWWMLRWIGFDQVAMLDGGLSAWVAEDRPLSTEESNRPAKQLSVTLRPDLIADGDQVFAAIGDTNVNIVDALGDAHYRGDFSMYGRPGHIPSATNLPSSDLLDETGFYRHFDELEMMIDSNRADRVITYCGGGVAAASVAFTFHRLGFKDVAVYMGSLQEWTADPANPMSLHTQ